MRRQRVFSYADMDRGLNVGPVEVGSFVPERAEVFTETTYNDQGGNRTGVSIHTNSDRHHETLYRTSRGRWVLRQYGREDRSRERWEYVDDATARAWLERNGDAEAVARYLTPPSPSDRQPAGRGRPATVPEGDLFSFKFPDDLRARVEARAARAQSASGEVVSLAEMIRRLLTTALDVEERAAEGTGAPVLVVDEARIEPAFQASPREIRDAARPAQ